MLEIQFIQTQTYPSGTVGGHLVYADVGPEGQAKPFLAELQDAHPDFAAHLVKAVAIYNVVAKILSAEPPGGPMRTLLKRTLAESDGAAPVGGL